MSSIVSLDGRKTELPDQQIRSVTPFAPYEPGGLYVALLFCSLLKVALVGVALVTLVAITGVRQARTHSSAHARAATIKAIASLKPLPATVAPLLQN